MEKWKMCQETSQNFYEKTPNRSVEYTFIINLLLKLFETDSIRNEKNTITKLTKSTRQNKTDRLVGSFIAGPSDSVRRVIRQSGVWKQ